MKEYKFYVTQEVKNKCLRKYTKVSYKNYFFKQIDIFFPEPPEQKELNIFIIYIKFFKLEVERLRKFKPSEYTRYVKEKREKYMKYLLALKIKSGHNIYNICARKKRNKLIKLRFTEDEFALVKERAKMYGLSITELLYFSASNVTVNRFDDKLVCSYIKELKKSVNYLYVELNRIAINRDEYTSFFEDKKRLKNLLDAIITVKEI